MNKNEIKKQILRIDNINERLSMASPKILDNVESCILTCMEDNVDGDFVETGVWRGGCSILAYNLYKQLKLNKKVYLYDSFAGLPPPDATNYPVDAGDIHYLHTELSVSLESVKKNFKLFSELDDSVIFIAGWFRDTIPMNNIDKISILRLDGHMYESTIDPLEYLYPKLSIGGFCIIDDYIHKGARSAVDYYRAKHNIEDEVITIDPTPGVYPSSYWRKTR